MSQPPPRDQGQPSDQGQPPSWPAGNQSPRPSGDQLPAWPSGKPDQGQPPAWPSGKPDQGQPPAWPSGKPDQGQPPAWPSGGSGQGQSPTWPSGGSGQGQPPSWPSPGQAPPPSWPGDGPGQGQGQPPSWTPGGQPPYPGPGYRYGYRQRPPRFRRRHPFRGAIIGLVLFIIFGFVVRNITTSHNTVSVTPFPSASGAGPTGSQAPPGKTGSHFDLADGSGHVYRLTLVKVIDPATGADQFSTPDNGKRFVGLVFTIKALTGSPQNEDANNDAVVVGGNRQNYQADFDRIAGYTNFDTGMIHVAQGDTVDGFGHVPGAGRRDGLEGPVDRAERVRLDGGVGPARIACPGRPGAGPGSMAMSRRSPGGTGDRRAFSRQPGRLAGANLEDGRASAARRAAAVSVTVGGVTGERGRRAAADAGFAHFVVGRRPGRRAGTRSAARPEAQWVIVPNVTADDQIVCQRIPPAGSVAETMWLPPS